MRYLILALLGSLIFVGCSKDGAGSHLMNGGQTTVTTDPQPTDINFPQPGTKPR